MLSGKLISGSRGWVAFSHRQHLSRNGRSFFATSNAFAETTIPAQSRETSDNEIAQSAQAGEGFGVRTASDSQPAHFDNGSGNQGRFGIVAKSKPVANAGGNGDDVLERATQLDSEQIIAGIDPKGGTIEERLCPRGSSQVAAGCHNRGRKAASHFEGESGTGQRRAFGLRSVLGKDSAHRQPRLIFNSFSDADDHLAKPVEVGGYFAEDFGGHCHDDAIGALTRPGGIGFEAQSCRQTGAGQVTLIISGALQVQQV